MDHIKIIKWSPLKLFYKSTIHEKCAHCPYKTLKFGERSDSLKSFSGDQFSDSRQNRRTHIVDDVGYIIMITGQPVTNITSIYNIRSIYDIVKCNIYIYI